MTPAAVLFDLDGVLLDSRVAIVRCIQHGLRAQGVDVPEAAELERFIGPPLVDAFAELAGPELVAACLASYRERYVQSSLEETTVVAGAREALAEIAGHVPVAVATSKPRAFAEPLCKRLGLAPSLRAVVGPELDAPEEVKTTTVRRALASRPAPTRRWSATAATTSKRREPTGSGASGCCGGSATRRSCGPRAPTRSSPIRLSWRTRSGSEPERAA